ncbi:DUF5980 family protein [Streptosporangium sp. H16]|uniref:DUF5980 family protein n=1 Tax=Streptosporangium sp. H16 TaxID=3444184 RepID=UPI003F78FA42
MGLPPRGRAGPLRRYVRQPGQPDRHILIASGTPIAPGSNYPDPDTGSTTINGFVQISIPPLPVGVYTSLLTASDGTETQSVPVTINVKESCYQHRFARAAKPRAPAAGRPSGCLSRFGCGRVRGVGRKSGPVAFWKFGRFHRYTALYQGL